MRIITALNDGPSDFKPVHVKALWAQIQQHSVGAEFSCITNQKILGVDCIPSIGNWPGWWIKLEVYRPDIRGDVLWMDLDTVITGSLTEILATRRLTMLRDFYRDGKKLKEGLQASLMMLPEAARAQVWADWVTNPTLHMAHLNYKGEQPMLEKHFHKTADRWQDVLPGQTVSWKVDCGGGNLFQPARVPANARVIVFHGKPRPWDVPEFQHLYESN